MTIARRQFIQGVGATAILASTVPTKANEPCSLEHYMTIDRRTNRCVVPRWVAYTREGRPCHIFTQTGIYCSRNYYLITDGLRVQTSPDVALKNNKAHWDAASCNYVTYFNSWIQAIYPDSDKTGMNNIKSKYEDDDHNHASWDVIANELKGIDFDLLATMPDKTEIRSQPWNFRKYCRDIIDNMESEYGPKQDDAKPVLPACYSER
jgi:hypothetical protein